MCGLTHAALPEGRGRLHEPGLPEGCCIFIDSAQHPLNGSVAVVSIDGADYMMRRLYNTGRTVVLPPDSWDDCYEDIVMTREDEHAVKYVGTVVWFQPAEEMK